MSDEGIADVLNVKCDPVLIGSLRMQEGFYPAYHMNKETWISVLLDQPERDETIKNLLALSYEITKRKERQESPAIVRGFFIPPDYRSES